MEPEKKADSFLSTALFGAEGQDENNLTPDTDGELDPVGKAIEAVFTKTETAAAAAPIAKDQHDRFECNCPACLVMRIGWQKFTEDNLDRRIR